MARAHAGDGKDTPGPARRTTTWGRAPLPLYRVRLGWLFGHRRVLLEHRSRDTGRPERTVLAVARWDASERRLVLTGTGPEPDWYRDVLATPRVRVTIGHERDVTACAVQLAPARPDEPSGIAVDMAARRRGRAVRAHRHSALPHRGRLRAV
jgi:deazaflavin-dependent oxidoreductase (nitroreductase family)